jgi:hypothetical protein
MCYFYSIKHKNKKILAYARIFKEAPNNQELRSRTLDKRRTFEKVPS